MFNFFLGKILQHPKINPGYAPDLWLKILPPVCFAEITLKQCYLDPLCFITFVLLADKHTDNNKN